MSRRIATPGAGVLLLLAGTGMVHADSALLGGPAPGTQLNPAGMISHLARDPVGLSSRDDVTRTPTGLMYPMPFQLPVMSQSKTDSDWWSSGWVDGGGLGSFDHTHSSQFQQYGDWSSGPVASAGYLAENRKTAFYLSGNAENIGRGDQTYQLKLGRYGVFDVTLFFDETPHLLSTSAKSIWTGVGTGNLTLKSGLVPGASTVAQVNAVAAASAPTDLKITRDKAGFSVNYKMDDEWTAIFQLSNEWRSGTRPLGGTFGYPSQNAATQLVQPIHYTTLNMTASVRYSGDETQANLTYTGSVFRNELQSVTWQNPGLTSTTGPGVYIPTLGNISLPPSNEYHSIKADVADALASDLRLTGSMTYTIMRQNEALIPPTVDSGTIRGLATTINLSQWNTSAALSTSSAHAAINTFRAFAQLEYMPSSDLTFTVAIKDNNEENLTNYVSFNPLTGQYGYIAIDGGLASYSPRLAGVYEPGVPGSVVQIRNMPFANDNLELDAIAAWRLSNHMKLETSYTHNNIRHSVREVPDADDDRLRVQFIDTGNNWGSLRASYEFASLVGSTYTSNPYTLFYSAALPGYVPRTQGGDPSFTLANLRKFDVGNRIEHTFHVQSNFILSPRSDLQLTGDVKSDAYDAEYGLRAATRYDLNAAYAWQISSKTSFNVFYDFEFNNSSVAGINPIGGPVLGTSAGSANYPLANAWYQKDSDLDHTVGASLHHSFDNVTIDLNYSFTKTNSVLSYTYATTGAFFNFLTPAQAGNQFPDNDFLYHVLEANLRWQYTSAIAMRFYYRLDYQDLSDFHYTGLKAGVVNNNIYLGVGPENYTAQAIGTFVQYAF